MRAALFFLDVVVFVTGNSNENENPFEKYKHLDKLDERKAAKRSLSLIQVVVTLIIALIAFSLGKMDVFGRLTRFVMSIATQPNTFSFDRLKLKHTYNENSTATQWTRLQRLMLMLVSCNSMSIQFHLMPIQIRFQF